MGLYLKNATYVHWENLKFRKGHIKVQSGQDPGIVFISNIPDTLDAEDELIDCEGKIVTRAFGCGHYHSYLELSKGFPGLNNPVNFYQYLKQRPWKIASALDKEMIEISAWLTAVACLKSGTTLIFDHHSSPAYISGSLDIISNVFDQAGLNHLLCYEISDKDGPEKTTEAFEVSSEYLAKHCGLTGLHASFTVDDKTLEKAVSLMDKYSTGIHIHVAENPYDQEATIKKHGRRVVERLKDFGVLCSEAAVFAHCLHLDKLEREYIQYSGAFVAQNNESNINNRHGIFNPQGLGSNIFLGTDGLHADMIRCAQASFLTEKCHHQNLEMSMIYDRLRNIHHYMKKNAFPGDHDANLVIFDYDFHTEVNEQNFLYHFFTQMNSKHVLHVISNGRIVVRDGKNLRIDEKTLLKQAFELSRKLKQVCA